MCQFFSKSADQCFQYIKQAARGAFKNNILHDDIKKAIVKANLSNRECSV